MLAKLFHTISKIYSKVFGQDFESSSAYTESWPHRERSWDRIASSWDSDEVQSPKGTKGKGKGILMPGIDRHILY